jgi:hypothetical protein
MFATNGGRQPYAYGSLRAGGRATQCLPSAKRAPASPPVEFTSDGLLDIGVAVPNGLSLIAGGIGASSAQCGNPLPAGTGPHPVP